MNDKAEHEASDPIRLPVRYDDRDVAIYDADGSVVIAWISHEYHEALEIGEHIAKCINERPQLLAETLRLREEVEKFRLALESLTPQGSEFYNDPAACVEYVNRYRHSQYESIKVAVKARRVAEQEVERLKAELEEASDPYMGWCDVEGCGRAAASGGSYWRESGYWHVCSEHGRWARDGKPRPAMLSEAVRREASRDPVTGILPSGHEVEA